MKTYTFKCKNCGSKSYIKNSDNEYVCEYCGAIEIIKPEETSKTQETSETKTSKFAQVLESFVNENLARFLICLIFGVLGVHKFVDGKAVMGFVYLFTLGLFGIGYIIDVISYGIEYLSKVIENLKKI